MKTLIFLVKHTKMIGNFALLFLLWFSTLFAVSCSSSAETEEKNSLDQSGKTSMLPTHFVDTTGQVYPWKKNYTFIQSIYNRVNSPEGYERTNLKDDPFGTWLRMLPVKPGHPKVLLHDGSEKYRQDVHAAVLDIDVGTRDLQQCADAVMRLRAEYLFSNKKYSSIHFNFTSGDVAKFSDWSEGKRPVVNGNSVSWQMKAGPDRSWNSFRKYMDVIFTYCGTSSLQKELVKVADGKVKPGDVFIYGGFPGHAVMVVDVALNAAGKKIFLLAQSYMPAQEIHILKNPNSSDLSPWYEEEIDWPLKTPEWSFEKGSHYRWE